MGTERIAIGRGAGEKLDGLVAAVAASIGGQSAILQHEVLGGGGMCRSQAQRGKPGEE